MKNNLQISLFLEDNTVFKPNELSYELGKNFEDLQDPIILPENKNFPQEANAPILLFIKNNNFQFICNFYTITITFANEYIKIVNDSIKIIMEILKKFKIVSTRIGYVSNYSFDSNFVNDFKKSMFCDESIIKSKDFEVSWLNLININEKEVNCWIRYYTNKQLNDKLNIIFDINTKHEETTEINKSFVLDFIKKCDEYMDNNLPKE